MATSGRDVASRCGVKACGVDGAIYRVVGRLPPPVLCHDILLLRLEQATLVRVDGDASLTQEAMLPSNPIFVVVLG